ncbi:MAG: Gfo/Idh/MocA family oxidoreductase [Candidatus Hydrogenedentes bacterium]|nr:Gfo/Idh/MocA family oxidoreductase [Candidatus Hydrogenedentota bacterium]
MNTSSCHDINRRDFLRRAGQGAAVTGFGAAAYRVAAREKKEPVDPRAPKTGKVPKPDQVLGIGIIGVGGMGGGHLKDLVEREKAGQKLQVRAISDVYTRRQKNRKERVKAATGRDIEAYYDYTKLLERDDIDAVIIATPDHWHALNSIHAMEAGKDVYCQKPVTLTVEEALDVRDAAYRTGRVFQCGAQRCSDDWFWQARKFIKDGGLGKILYAQMDYSRNSGSPDNPQGGEWNYHIDDDATDDPNGGEGYIDWQQWLGPAPRRPFSKPRFFQFRKFWDYSGGIATDLLYHYIAPMTIALDCQAPEKVSAGGGIFVQHDDREVPDTFLVVMDYPEDFSILMTSSMANRQANPAMIRGHRATLRPGDAGIQITPEDEFKSWFKEKYGTDGVLEIPNEPREEHMDNWLNAIRNRTECHCPPEIAYRAQVAAKLACDSYRQEKVMFWDNAAEQYVDSHPRPERSSKVPAIPS